MLKFDPAWKDPDIIREGCRQFQMEFDPLLGACYVVGAAPSSHDAVSIVKGKGLKVTLEILRDGPLEMPPSIEDQQ